jgi:hypothetical protein
MPILSLPRTSPTSTFSNMIQGPNIFGKEERGGAILQKTPETSELRIFLPRIHLLGRHRYFPLTDLVADFCGIRDNSKLRLLEAALSEPRTGRVHELFADAGFSRHADWKGE